MKRFVCLCLTLCLLASVLSACSKKEEEEASPSPPRELGPFLAPSAMPPVPEILDPVGSTVKTRFNPPVGFERVSQEPGSFGEYLQNLPLKEDGAPVLLFDGREKLSLVHAAVVDMDVGETDVQQGTDALIRLRAEYLYGAGRYGEIVYHFLSGFSFPFSKWAEGYRVNVGGKTVEWEKKADPKDDYETFRKYLNILFAYSNARSLESEMTGVDDPQIGDIYVNFEYGGVMIADMARNPATGETVFLLVQATFPAQEIHILKNEGDPALSPWYSGSFSEEFETPEGTYKPGDLRRFHETSWA